MYRFSELLHGRKQRPQSCPQVAPARPWLEELELRNQPAVLGPPVPGALLPGTNIIVPVEVSNILGNMYVQQLEMGNLTTGGVLPYAPAAGPDGAIGAGGLAGQGMVPFTTLSLGGVELGKGSTVATPFNNTSTAPPTGLALLPAPSQPTQPLSPAPVGQQRMAFPVPLPEGAGNGQTNGQGTASGTGGTRGEGAMPPTQQPAAVPNANPMGGGTAPSGQPGGASSQNPQGGQTAPVQPGTAPTRNPEGTETNPRTQPGNSPTPNPEPMSLRLDESMSPVTLVWGTRMDWASGPAGPFAEYIPHAGNDWLLKTNLPPQDDRKADAGSAVAAIALGLAQLSGMEWKLAQNGKGPAGWTRRED